MSVTPQSIRGLVLVPTYNERENLAAITRAIHAAQPDLDVVVIDDASPDGTGELADRLAAADPRIKVLHRAGKEGLRLLATVLDARGETDRAREVRARLEEPKSAG